MTTAPLFTAKTPPGFYAAQAPSPYAPQTPSMGPSPESGAISGGLLRPGSIDQTTFLQMLQQQQQNRAAAGVGGKAVPMAVQGFPGGVQGSAAPSIPTLSSAQFAALVGAQNADQGLAAAPQEGLAADPRGMAAAQAQLQAQALIQAQLQAGKAAAPQGPALKLSGAANRNLFASPPAGNAPAPAPTDPEMPTISRNAQPQQMAALDATAVESPAADDAPTITRRNAPVLEASSAAGTEQTPATSKSETAAKGDPNVVHLKSPPDKEQIAELRMRNKRWVVDETPGARQLFFGADGEFGWDDFLDMINPLQHIPGIAQIYRAVTGDEINGAASLLGALPLGPLGGLGLVATVVDLAVKDTTGDDMGGNVMAMVFGKDGKPEGGTAAPADMADSGATGKATVETASRQTAFAMSSASELHSSCRG